MFTIARPADGSASARADSIVTVTALNSSMRM